MKLITWDFEFTETTEAKVKLVSCALDRYDGGELVESKDFWLYNQDYSELRNYLMSHRDHILVAFGAEAEAKSVISLDLDPLIFQWVCLHLEYRCLQNHSYELLHGEQLIDGRVKRTYPYGEKGKQSYGAVAFKLLGAVIDSKEKDEVRQIIIEGKEIEENKERILKYGRSDVKYLYKILKAQIAIYKKRVPRNLRDLTKQMLLRGEYAARTAKMVSLGYPINRQWLDNFASNAPMVIQECQRDINRQFPANPPFRWNKKEQRFSLNQKVLKDYIHDNHKEGWMLTDKGQYSLSLEAWESKYHYRHEYPEGNLGAQMLRYLKLSQSMKGYNPHAEKSIFNDLGSDNRVRCYLNPYGAQSSRTQPASTGFVFLKPASQRSLVQAKDGRAIGDLDYSSEEFLLAALMSGDRKMLEAYKSGDVYLAFGKDIGYIPKDGTKKSHKKERDICKAVVLSLSYLMTEYGLAYRLTSETGRVWTEAEAKELIDLFDNNYEVFANWRREQLQEYQDKGYLMLKDGWYLWGDNEKFRSVANAPVQGCLHPDSRVLVKDKGYQRIESLSGLTDIQVWEGTKFVRADCVPSGKKQLVEVHFRNGQIIKCSPEHKFWCIDNEGKGSWKTPSQFMKVQRIRRSYNTENFDCDYIVPSERGLAHNSKEVGLEHFTGSKHELGILLGRLASKGQVSVKRGALWVVAEHEKAILPYLKSLIQKFGVELKESTVKRKGKQPLYHVRLYSKKLCWQLEKELNIKNSLEHPFLWHSKEMMKGFIEGYVDGDGCIVNNVVQVAFGKGIERQEYARSLQKMFHIFNVPCKIYCYSYRTNLGIKERDIYTFSQHFSLLNPRKQNKVLLAVRHKVPQSYAVGDTEIVSKVVVTDDFIDMYDIANCPDHRFMTEGLVTHNTGAVIMRRAVSLAQDVGLDVIFTLHDAIYIEYTMGDLSAIDTLKLCMEQAFIEQFEGEMREEAKCIRVDPQTWGIGYDDPKLVDGNIVYQTVTTPKGLKVAASSYFYDARAAKDFDMIKKYMFESSGQELLGE
jgi:hypothetical protein